MMLLVRFFSPRYVEFRPTLLVQPPIFHVAPLAFCSCDAMLNFAENKMMLIYERIENR